MAINQTTNIRILRQEYSKFDRYLIFHRFLQFVVIGNQDECWKWLGTKNGKGYGRFGWDKAADLAHIAAYLLFIGKIPKRHGHKLCILHSCDNPPCVNPFHLWPGTHRQNIRDMISKGRQKFGLNTPSGEDHYKAKEAGLTLERVDDIRRKYKSGRYTQEELAIRFQINRKTIGRIINYKNWIQ